MLNLVNSEGLNPQTIVRCGSYAEVPRTGYAVIAKIVAIFPECVLNLFICRGMIPLNAAEIASCPEKIIRILKNKGWIQLGNYSVVQSKALYSMGKFTIEELANEIRSTTCKKQKKRLKDLVVVLWESDDIKQIESVIKTLLKNKRSEFLPIPLQRSSSLGLL